MPSVRLPALTGLTLLVALACTGASASASEPFSEARFRSLQEEGVLVLVEVAADWCPVCKQQKELIGRYLEEHPEVPLHVLRVDFDDQKEWVTHFEAPRQSTLILYRGKERVWFSVAETDPEVIFAAIDEAHAS